MDSFPLQHSGGPTVSESPANDLPPKYEDLLSAEGGSNNASSTSESGATAAATNLAPSTSSSAAAVRGETYF